MIDLTPEEKKVAEIIQKDIPIAPRPFRLVGEGIGLDEDSVLDIIIGFRDRGIIRKVGAILRHQPAGFVNNALILWAVPADRTDEVGMTLSSFPDVTHCYERQPPFEGKYSIFSMIHMKESNGKDLIQALMRATGITDVQILTSVEEFKKSSMEYFDDP
jgi:siroheme decarboxylase